MTVINHRSISGITSITTPAGSDNLLTVHTSDQVEKFRIKPDGIVVSGGSSITGIATASNFKTGTTNVHNVGVELAGINVLGADTPIGTGATIYNSGAAVFTGIVTAANVTVSSQLNIPDAIVHSGNDNAKIRFPTTDTFTVETAGSERFRIKSDGKVGIGSAIPSAPLDVEGGTKSTQYQLKKAGDSTSIGAFLQLTNLAGDSNSNDVTLTAAHSTNSIVLRAAAKVTAWTYYSGGYQERLRIDQIGRLLLGPGAIALPKGSAAGSMDLDNGNITMCIGGNTNSTGRTNSTNKLNRITSPHYTNAEEPVALVSSYNVSNQNIISYGGGSGQTNAVTKHSFYTGPNTTSTTGVERVRISSDGSWSKLLDGSNTQAAFGGTGQINGITALPSMSGTPFVLGRDTGSTRSAWFGGHLRFNSGYGIDFSETAGPDAGATGSSEILDDYEEGSWSGVVMDGNSTNISINNVVAKYVKVGQLVYCYFNITRNETGSRTGSITFWQLPFTSANSTLQITGTWWLDEGGVANGDSVGGAMYVIQNTNNASFVHSTSPGQQATNRYLQYSEWNQHRPIYGSFTYQTPD